MFSVKKKASAVLLMLYTLGYFIWVMTFHGSHASRVLISDILQILPPIFVFSTLLTGYLKNKLHQDKFWLLITFGCGSYLLSQSLWNYYEIARGIYNPAFSAAAFLWAFTTLSYITALASKIKQKKSGQWGKYFFIDTMIIMCIAVAVIWQFSIGPALSNISGKDNLSELIYLAYPAGNLICLFLSINLYFSLVPEDTERRPLYIICLSFLVMFVANSIYSHMSLIGVYASGSLMDPLWALYIMLLGLAGKEYYQLSEDKINKPVSSFTVSYPPRLFLILPFISVVFLFGLMLYFKTPVVWFCSALSISLITLRHALIIIQNKELITTLGQLNNSLEAKVADRTQELYSMAFYDQLTGLPNRRMFEDSLKKAVSKAKRSKSALALIFLDLDRFKTINDNFGHSMGDLMLKEVAMRIKSCVNREWLISRQGGDEFAIIAEGYADEQELARLAEQILKQMIKPINLLDQNLHSSCSIGIAIHSSNNENPETLMRYADAAMYYSKEKGKNTYQFYTYELDKSISKKLELETELSKALESDQFLIYYQPQVDTLNGCIIGAEALLRWKHPEYGFISPGEFIPVAEESGIIVELGLWVLRNACAQAKRWHDEGYTGLKVGVNIAPAQIQQENFVGLVSAVLKETGLKPEFLDLEITESASFQNEAEVIQKLNELKRIGVQISIDDFGTGYSSLSYLNKLPVDTLKIAQQFVRNIKNDMTNMAIISSIIAVAQSLKLKVIAEGVEENFQYNFLKTHNCFEMQGYIFSKPVPLQEFYRLIEEKEITQKLKLDA